MAKTKLRRIAHRKGLHFRQVQAYVEVARSPGATTKVGQFLACVAVGGTEGRRYTRTACGEGRNPRQAIAAALRKQANLIAKRSGGFAGMK